MVNKFNIFFSCCLIIVLFLGCRKIIEPKDLPEQDARIVLNCVIYNDSIIRANISSSKSIISGKEYKFLDAAVCELYEDGNFIEKLQNQKKGNFVSQLIAKANKKYTLRVSNTGFKSAEASTILTDSIHLFKIQQYDNDNAVIKAEIQSANYGSIRGIVKYQIVIKDPPTINNYYKLKAAILLYDSLDNFLSVANSYININNGSNNNIYDGDGISVDDQVLVNGNEVLLDVSIGFETYENPLPPVYKAEIYLTMANINEDLYKYKSSLNQQASVTGQLFSEPVFVYNNITNGLGIMGASNQRERFLTTIYLVK